MTFGRSNVQWLGRRCARAPERCRRYGERGVALEVSGSLLNAIRLEFRVDAVIEAFDEELIDALLPVDVHAAEFLSLQGLPVLIMGHAVALFEGYNCLFDPRDIFILRLGSKDIFDHFGVRDQPNTSLLTFPLPRP